MTIETEKKITQEFQENIKPEDATPNKFKALFCRSFNYEDEDDSVESKAVDERFSVKNAYSIH